MIMRKDILILDQYDVLLLEDILPYIKSVNPNRIQYMSFNEKRDHLMKLILDKDVFDQSRFYLFEEEIKDVENHPLTQVPFPYNFLIKTLEFIVKGINGKVSPDRWKNIPVGTRDGEKTLAEVSGNAQDLETAFSRVLYNSKKDFIEYKKDPRLNQVNHAFIANAGFQPIWKMLLNYNKRQNRINEINEKLSKEDVPVYKKFGLTLAKLYNHLLLYISRLPDLKTAFGFIMLLYGLVLIMLFFASKIPIIGKLFGLLLKIFATPITITIKILTFIIRKLGF